MRQELVAYRRPSFKVLFKVEEGAGREMDNVAEWTGKSFATTQALPMTVRWRQGAVFINAAPSRPR